LGAFYYPTNGSSTSLTNLFDAGSRNATNAGLYHFTTTTNQVKEATTTVDTGYHYVAVDANGNPIDTDSDGIPDYWKIGTGMDYGIGGNRLADRRRSRVESLDYQAAEQFHHTLNAFRTKAKGRQIISRLKHVKK